VSDQDAEQGGREAAQDLAEKAKEQAPGGEEPEGEDNEDAE
jgi:hypothetical protein